MSEELVRRATALMSGDGHSTDEELAEMFHPDVVLDLSVRIFNPHVYEGYDGLRRFYADSREIWEHVQVEITEIVEQGDRYLVLGNVRSHARTSGVAIEATSAGIWTAVDGRLKRYRLLAADRVDREEALAALRGQSPQCGM